MESRAGKRRERSGITFNTHVALAASVLTIAIWFSSGTMAPYGATAEYPTVLEPCHYLVNVDHEHFAAVYRMLGGADPSTWAGSVVLRRLLFPVIAYPFVRAAGFMVGGLLASLLVNALALVFFARFVRERIGERGAILAAWLLATYPGITYWAGLPYAYVAIVPASLFCTILIYRMHEAHDLRNVTRAALLLGVLFTAYDLLPFFGTAAVLILLARRRIRWAAPAIGLMLLPNVLIAIMFVAISVPVVNSNTAGYVTVVLSYLHPLRDLQGTVSNIVALPLVFASNFLYSNMVFLPLLFLGAIAIAFRRRLTVLSLPDKTLLLAGLMLFLVLNAAPPYYGWQMRGYWMARLFQPVFPALLLAIARVSQALGDRDLGRWRLGAVLAIAANASVAFGPVLLNPMAAWVYHKFYVHSPPRSLLVNLERFGRRPLGACSDSHAWDGIPNPNTPLNRPAFMYRYPPRTAE